MSLQITANDVILQINDYLSSYTTGNVSGTNRLRALNRAIEFFQRRLLLPSDKRIYTFKYSQDVRFYDMPEGFNEGLILLHSEEEYNTDQRRWTYRPDAEILIRASNPGINRFWGYTSINQKNQIVLIGPNNHAGSTLDGLDTLGNWVASNDASGLRIDTNQKYEGAGSLAFDMDIATSGATKGTISSAMNLDVTNWHENSADFKLRVELPVTSFSSIDLTLMSSPTDYYKISATLQADGTAFETGTFQLLSWSFDDAVIFGSPDDQAINTVRFDFNEGTGFALASDIRMDKFYVTVPDYLDLVYASAYKGTDSTGATEKILIDDASDILYFGNIAPDLIDPIAMRAAMILIPQLRKDEQFYSLYSSTMKDSLKVFGRVFPRQRTNNMGKTIFRKN